MREDVMSTSGLIQISNSNAHHEVELFRIAAQMETAGLPDEFIAAAIRTALDYEGVSDLVMMWANENDQQDRNDIVADIQEMIDACFQTTKREKLPKINLNDLDAVAKNIRQFKDSLLEIVINKGGIHALA